MSATESTAELRDRVQSAIETVESSLQFARQQREQLQLEIADHNKKAREFVRQGNDERARRELKAKRTKMQRVEELDASLEELNETRDELESQLTRLQDANARV